MLRNFLAFIFFLLFAYQHAAAQHKKNSFKVIAFYTATNDLAHISFVEDANKWFPAMAAKYGFQYDSTRDWSNLNEKFLSNYQVVIFFDTRPETPAQRKAFEEYMKKGGAWMGFHFAAFALTPSAFPQNWDWYHEDFIGAGSYKSNTWRPTSAVLKVETKEFPATRNLPDSFKSQPNEWYRWTNDLTKNRDIKILLSIAPSSFPLGTGPKQHEIWHSGYYPVVWTNTKYRMIYFNMGHNDMDYGGTNQPLSHSFGNEHQDRLIIDALLSLGRKR